MQNSTSHIDVDRLSVLTGALLLAMALMRVLDAPTRPLLHTTIFGSPLGVNLTVTSFMTLIILGLSVTAVTSLLQDHPLAQQGKIPYAFMFWIVPGLLGVALAGWLNRFYDLRIWTAVLLACAVLLPFALTVEYQAVDPRQRQSPRLQWSQVMLVHLTAVILFTLIYDARIRSLLSGTAVLLIATLLSTRLFWISQNNITRAFQYGGLVGLILGQITWGLNYWRLSGLQGGLFLLLVFYLIVGLMQQFLQGGFDDGQNGRHILLEYSGVTIIALILILLIAP